MNRNRVGTKAVVCLSLVVAPAYAQQRQGGAPSTGRNIVMICGNENQTVLNCTSIGDIFVKNHLELDMGHKVIRVPHDTAADKMLAFANAADLVIVVESVGKRFFRTNSDSSTRKASPSTLAFPTRVRLAP